MEAATPHTREVEASKKCNLDITTQCLQFHPPHSRCLKPAKSALMQCLPCLGNAPAVMFKAFAQEGIANPLQCATATKGRGAIWLHGTKMLGQYNPGAAPQHQTPAIAQKLPKKQGNLILGLHQPPACSETSIPGYWLSGVLGYTEKKKESLSPSCPVVLRI